MNALGRVIEATERRIQVDLAAVHDIKQSSISDAMHRSSIPSDWLIKILRFTGITPDKINGPMAKLIQVNKKVHDHSKNTKAHTKWASESTAWGTTGFPMLSITE